jgi:hypothetical protein
MSFLHCSYTTVDRESGCCLTGQCVAVYCHCIFTIQTDHGGRALESKVRIPLGIGYRRQTEIIGICDGLILLFIVSALRTAIIVF